MNLEVVYKINEIQDEFGNVKENFASDRLFYLRSALVGGTAWLMNVKDMHGSVRTSRIEKIEILDNKLLITTLNSRYELEAVIESV